MDHLTQLVERFLRALPGASRVWVAFSGGVDSTVLLHATLPLQERWPIGVIHVNHQLSVFAGQWQEHCKQTAGNWGVERCICETVTVLADGDGLEQAARKARYTVFAEHMQKGDVLLMAHHLSDQAETFFLRLARGAGLAGMRAMPALRTFSDGHIGRPFLNVKKQKLLEYAREHRLTWVEDESNQSADFDRNFLRLNVLPILRERWPSFDNSVMKTTELLGQAESLLNRYLADDLVLLNARAERVGHSVELPPLLDFDADKCAALIRFWINSLGFSSPSKEQTSELFKMLAAKEDASPLLKWGGCEIRRFKKRIYCLPSDWQNHLTFKATYLNDLMQNDSFRALRLQPVNSQWGVYFQKDDLCMPMSLYNGSRRARPHLRQHSQTLKKLFQEYAVEPWLRPFWPVIVRQQTAVCLPGLWIEKAFAVEDSDSTFLDWYCTAVTSS